MSSSTQLASWEPMPERPRQVFHRPGNSLHHSAFSHIPQYQAYSSPPQSPTKSQRYTSTHVPHQPSIGIGPQSSWQSSSAMSPVVSTSDVEPWKSKGYPALSEWMASDNDFFIIRKFGKLNARIILMMQDRISFLEENLERIDLKCRDMEEGKGDNGTLRHDPMDSRLKILEELAEKLDKYNQFVLHHSELKARPKPLDYQIRNVDNWFSNNEHAISEVETKFITKKEDVMAVVPKSQVPLRKFVGSFDCVKKWGFFRDKRPDGVRSGPTIYNKDDRMTAFVTCITIVLGLAMLIGPLWWLQHASSVAASLASRLSIISVFIVLFTAVMGVVTVASPFEVLAATAAYSAVLMVFLQTNNPNSSP